MSLPEHHEWVPIQYREFYDIPRLFVIAMEGRTYLLDCQFDEALDEYGDRFEVFELTSSPAPDLQKSWAMLSASGVHLGAVLVADVEFDATRRQAVRPGFLSRVVR